MTDMRAIKFLWSFPTLWKTFVEGVIGLNDESVTYLKLCELARDHAIAKDGRLIGVVIP